VSTETKVFCDRRGNVIIAGRTRFVGECGPLRAAGLADGDLCGYCGVAFRNFMRSVERLSPMATAGVGHAEPL
jgi:hypothetical protein